jgi:hypothetical protein
MIVDLKMIVVMMTIGGMIMISVMMIRGAGRRKGFWEIFSISINENRQKDLRIKMQIPYLCPPVSSEGLKRKFR